MHSILLQGLIQFDSFGARQTNFVTILQYRPSNGECLYSLKYMQLNFFLIESLELHQFAYNSMEEENVTLMYLEAENVSTVWPGVYNTYMHAYSINFIHTY